MKINRLLIISVLVLLSSCGNNSVNQYSKDTYDAEIAVEYGEQLVEEMSYNETIDYYEEAIDYDEEENENKISKEGYINNSSSNFEESLEDMKKIVNSYNGHFTESNYYNNNLKYFETTIKVPVENFEELFSELTKCGVNRHNSSNIINESSGYYSLKSQIEVKKHSLDRIEDLISETEEPKEIISLYNTYFDLLSDIEILERKFDELQYKVSYSTIYFSLDSENTLQVISIPKDGLLEKIVIGINTSINNTLNFIQNIILFLADISVPILLITTIFIIIIKRIKSKRLKK